MRALAVVAGACVVLAVAGCSKSGESGTPQASAQTLTPDQLWDPCSLPDSAVAATGVKADTKNTNPLGSKSTGWKACSWNNDAYFLDVDSTTHTLDEVRSNKKFQNLHNVDVPGREAVSYTEGSWGSCGVDFPTSKGLVELIVRPAGSSSSAGDACAISLSAANSLNNLIPK
jgi:hypothetical protein